jgi:hypothetical protein
MGLLDRLGRRGSEHITVPLDCLLVSQWPGGLAKSVTFISTGRLLRLWRFVTAEQTIKKTHDKLLSVQSLSS